MLQRATPNSTIKSFATIFQFILNIDDLDLQPVESPDIQLSDLVWKIIFNKRAVGDRRNNVFALDIHVVARSADNITKWMCAADVTIKLFYKSIEAIRKSITKQQFSDEFASNSIYDFLEWNEFSQYVHQYNQHIHEKKAKFEIEISASPILRIAPSTFAQSFTKMQVVLKNINQLQESLSPEVVLRGVRWKIHTVKQDDGLGVFLKGVDEDFDLYWSYQVHANIKLVSFNLNAKGIEGTFIHVFHCGSTEFGYKKFIIWNNLISEKNEYVKDDIANLIVELKVEEPKLRPNAGVSTAT